MVCCSSGFLAVGSGIFEHRLAALAGVVKQFGRDIGCRHYNGIAVVYAELVDAQPVEITSTERLQAIVGKSGKFQLFKETAVERASKDSGRREYTTTDFDSPGSS